MSDGKFWDVQIGSCRVVCVIFSGVFKVFLVACVMVISGNTDDYLFGQTLPFGLRTLMDVGSV